MCLQGTREKMNVDSEDTSFRWQESKDCDVVASRYRVNRFASQHSRVNKALDILSSLFRASFEPLFRTTPLLRTIRQPLAANKGDTIENFVAQLFSLLETQQNRACHSLGLLPRETFMAFSLTLFVRGSLSIYVVPHSSPRRSQQCTTNDVR